jgi:hypothetical protein
MTATAANAPDCCLSAALPFWLKGAAAGSQLRDRAIWVVGPFSYAVHVVSVCIIDIFAGFQRGER